MSITKLSKHSQAGAGLLEVMIGLFILAIGLLGMAQLQSRALQQNNTAFLYSQALFLIDDITESARANRNFLSAYQTSLGETESSAATCDTAICTPDEIAEWDLAAWKADVADLLPAGRADIKVVGNVFTVGIEFDESRGEEDPIVVTLSTEI